MQSLASQACVSGDKDPAAEAELELLKTKLAEAKTAMAKENQEVNKLYRAKDLLGTTRTTIYQTVLKICKITKKTLWASEKKELKRYIL